MTLKPDPGLFGPTEHIARPTRHLLQRLGVDVAFQLLAGDGGHDKRLAHGAASIRLGMTDPADPVFGQLRAFSCAALSGQRAGHFPPAGRLA
jgi:hypothetical protein